MIELDHHELENLKRICCELRIGDDGFEMLSFAALEIRSKEMTNNWQSAPARRRQLSRISELSSELSKALVSLDYVDKHAIDEEMEKAAIELQLTEADPLREAFIRGGRSSEHASLASSIFCERVLLIGDLLLTLEQISSKARSDVVGQETGRHPRNEILSGYIQPIARCAHLHGLNVARGGPFHKLCEAVFLTAGICTDPDAAIRKFVIGYLPLYLKIWGAAANQGG